VVLEELKGQYQPHERLYHYYVLVDLKDGVPAHGFLVNPDDYKALVWRVIQARTLKQMAGDKERLLEEFEANL